MSLDLGLITLKLPHAEGCQVLSFSHCVRRSVLLWPWLCVVQFLGLHDERQTTGREWVSVLYSLTSILSPILSRFLSIHVFSKQYNIYKNPQTGGETLTAVRHYEWNFLALWPDVRGANVKHALDWGEK